MNDCRAMKMTHAKCRTRRAVGKPIQGREENREETGFQQQDVPLETEELAANRRERKIDQPQEKEARRGGDTGEQEKGEDYASGALGAQKAVAGVEPAKGG